MYIKRDILECPRFSTVILILLSCPLKSNGCKAVLTCTWLVTMLMGDCRNPPQFGNSIAQCPGSRLPRKGDQLYTYYI